MFGDSRNQLNSVQLQLCEYAGSKYAENARVRVKRGSVREFVRAAEFFEKWGGLRH